MMSLRLRLLLGAIAGIAVALTIAAFILVSAFEQHVRKRYVAELNSHLLQLAALVQVNNTGDISLRPASDTMTPILWPRPKGTLTLAPTVARKPDGPGCHR